MKERIAKFNLIIFVFIMVFGFFVSILESYKYLGFFQKHFYLSPYLVYFLSFISFVGLARSKRLLGRILRERPLRIFFGFGTILFFLSILFYVVLNELEINNYKNFSYSVFHIWPAGFIFPVLLSFETAFLFFLANPNFVKLDRKIYRKLRYWHLIKFLTIFISK